MLPMDQARVLHLLQQMEPVTGGLAPIPLIQAPYHHTTATTTLTAQISAEALAANAKTTAARVQQVAGFTTAAGNQAHVTAIASGSTEEEAAQAPQAVAGAALKAAQAALAKAVATSPTA
jgi:hypothetical protein